jgi:steroid Delta-isomerase
MLTETVRKDLALEYCARINDGDIDGLLSLFADDVRFEDPVGGSPVIGRKALRNHFTAAIAAGIDEQPGRPVAAQDGEHVAIPVEASMNYLPFGRQLAAAGLVDPPSDPAAARLHFSLVSVIRIGGDRLINNVKVYWGRTDVSVVAL